MAAGASNTLHTLYLHISADTSTTSGTPRYLFHLISRLHTLRICFHHDQHSPDSCFVTAFRHFLNASTFPASLHTLDIGAKASFCISWIDEIQCDCKPTELWALLDAALTKPLIGAVPHLRLFIKFCVESNKGCWFDDDLFASHAFQAIVDVLPDFRNTRMLPLKGSLNVVCSGQRDSDALEFM
jgi:hypothetical protein